MCVFELNHGQMNADMTRQEAVEHSITCIASISASESATVHLDVSLSHRQCCSYASRVIGLKEEVSS